MSGVVAPSIRAGLAARDARLSAERAVQHGRVFAATLLTKSGKPGKPAQMDLGSDMVRAARRAVDLASMNPGRTAVVIDTRTGEIVA